MLKFLWLPCALALLIPACRTTPPGSSGKLQAFQNSATRFHSVVSLPSFETTPGEIASTVTRTIASGNIALDRLGALPDAAVNFTNTVGALDDLGSQMSLSANRLSLIKETSTNAALRQAAISALKSLEEWMVGIDYRQDVYRALKAYAATAPVLGGEDRKLLDETLRDYRRAGMELPKPQRDAVELLRKDLASLCMDFESNVTRAEQSVTFTRADLEGVPADFLDQIKTGADTYTAKANITWHYIMVMDNARLEETRKKFLAAHDNLARAANLPLLEKILARRDELARRLGYASYADFETEPKMVGNAGTARNFALQLKAGLQPKFDAELAQFRNLKARQTGNTNAQIQLWDWRYFSNQLKKEKYNIDAEQLRVFFPYQPVLEGMFAIYQRIFNLRFERLDPPYKWIGDLQLYAVSDATSGEPLGLFYLDMFPREGKYNHFAQFGLVEGKQLTDGRYQRPVCALICNFPSSTKEHPSLMSHDDVETIFHEFGHAMHTILTRARYARFSGTSVPGDFVEAPSQMLENWPWDKQVLDSFAADYRDPSRKIPAEVLAKLKEARLATEATRYRRQLSFALADLALHSQIHATNLTDTLPLSNRELGEAFLPMLPDTAFVAYFGHLIGYGAGYYGYAWADAIAADMATVFENSPGGYFDKEVGLRLRREIYEPGNSRDVNVSIEKFLGRPRSIEPFLKRIGAKSP